MAERLLGEDKIGLPAAGALLSAGEVPVHPSTIGRWITRGAKTPDGRRVYLEAIRIGAKYVTTRQACARFVAALTPAGEDTAPAARTPAEQNRAADQAARALAAMGA